MKTKMIIFSCNAYCAILSKYMLYKKYIFALGYRLIDIPIYFDLVSD